MAENELGTSTVPYTEDIKATKPDFIKDFPQYASDNYELVSKEGLISTTALIYTVPDSKTLYITNLWLNQTAAGADNSCLLHLGTGSTQRVLLRISVKANNEANHAISCPMPIKVNSGDTVEGSVINAGSVAYAGFIGFLVSKAI